jgi:hypothetical protein
LTQVAPQQVGVGPKAEQAGKQKLHGKTRVGLKRLTEHDESSAVQTAVRMYEPVA